MDKIFRVKMLPQQVVKEKGGNGELWMLPMNSMLRGKGEDVVIR